MSGQPFLATSLLPGPEENITTDGPRTITPALHLVETAFELRTRTTFVMAFFRVLKADTAGRCGRVVA